MAVEISIKKKLGSFLLDVELHSEEKRIGILGGSGCGKTMTLKCLAGIETPDEGSIVVDGQVFFDKEKKINIPARERNIGYLFQNYALFPNMTVEKNIGAGLRCGKQEKKERVEELIQKFGLTGLEKHYPSQLSGGQQQRTALARILAYHPSTIMLDEPFSALDGYLKEKMQQEMKGILADFPGTVLMVTHSRDEIYRFSQEILVMDQGKSIHQGETKALFQNPRKVEAARLTGCKNISPIQKIGPNEVLALDWNLYLHTAKPVGDATYVGIRAHDLMPSTKGQQNTYEMELVDVTSSPFEQVYHVRERHIGKDSQPIWWKKDRNLDWEKDEVSFPVYLRFPEERLLLLE